MSKPLDVEHAVTERYSRAAQRRSTELCCPIDYNAKYLDVLPREILERDYGCGDPSGYLNRGERVLDLGSGAGKICYIAAQLVGAEGEVIGVDMNDEMLALAEAHRRAVGDRIGYHNVRFCKGKIQDLALDHRKLEVRLAQRPVTSPAELDALEAWKEEERRERPMIADDSIDVIVSNCVLNLVKPQDKRQLFAEMHRVLARGGRAVISDIVSDESVPEHLLNDAELWSGCISGAFREDAFLAAFEAAGFYGIEIVSRDASPWRTVEGIEFRAVTVQAYKGKEGACVERNQAVIYRGPFKSVTDDDGHTLLRGERMAVCDKTFAILTQAPYASSIEAIAPRVEIALADAQPFDCRRDARRDPRQSKGADYRETTIGGASCCDPDEGCC